jgi:hypothetical protein
MFDLTLRAVSGHGRGRSWQRPTQLKRPATEQDLLRTSRQRLPSNKAKAANRQSSNQHGAVESSLAAARGALRPVDVT